MSSNYNDLRVRRTQRFLKSAFISLLQEREFHKISVHALTERAEINRVTFYLHYRDMDDFIEQFVTELLTEIESILSYSPSTPFEREDELNRIIELLEYIATNALTYKTLLVTKSIPNFTQRLVELFHELIFQSNDAVKYDPFPSTIPKDIAAWYGISAMVGTIALWLGKDMPYTPHYLAKQMVSLNPFRRDEE